MKAAVLQFPGSNCDRDMYVALKEAGADVTMVWHKDADLPAGVDVIGVPGGFSYGDYLRCGAIAANSPITAALKAHVERGGYAFGICNGFQVLTEAKLLPGALLRNASVKYICNTQELIVENTDSAYTSAYTKGQSIGVPIAHHDGNYTADAQTLDMLEGEGRVAFRYGANPNGSDRDIAGILSANKRVLGMMPHPERAANPAHGNQDGKAFFASLISSVVPA